MDRSCCCLVGSSTTRKTRRRRRRRYLIVFGTTTTAAAAALLGARGTAVAEGFAYVGTSGAPPASYPVVLPTARKRRAASSSSSTSSGTYINFATPSPLKMTSSSGGAGRYGHYGGGGNDDDDVVFVAAVRTPLCRAGRGAFSKVPASTLFQAVLKEVVDRAAGSAGARIAPGDVDDVCVGNVLLPPVGFAVLRMAQLSAGFPDKCALSTTNRQCASGLQAIANIAGALQADQIKVGIAAGVESMSLHKMPGNLDSKLIDWKITSSREALDCLLPMGITSETVVKEFGLERHVLDAFAVESHAKAAAAREAGKFDTEIVPVNGVRQDDGIRPDTTIEVLSRLKPAFIAKGGVTTAGNSSQLTDGAAAVLMMKRREARRRRMPILATWRGFAAVGVQPKIMGIGPLAAIPAVLERTNLKVDDVDVYEINEAFASQAVYCRDRLELDPSKVNPNGGAIALGHPLGCTGTRLVVSIVHELLRRQRSGRDAPASAARYQYGVVSMCIGSGQGAAAVIEAEPQSAL